MLKCIFSHIYDLRAVFNRAMVTTFVGSIKLYFILFPQLLASASYDNNICIYKEEDDDWECRATLQGHTSTVWSLCFDVTGQRLASCSDDRTVKIWKEYPSESGEKIEG